MHTFCAKLCWRCDLCLTGPHYCEIRLTSGWSGSWQASALSQGKALVIGLNNLLMCPSSLTLCCCVPQAITRLELQMAGLALTQGTSLVIDLSKADAVPGSCTDRFAIH
jgi:hypothetical protein